MLIRQMWSMVSVLYTMPLQKYFNFSVGKISAYPAQSAAPVYLPHDRAYPTPGEHPHTSHPSTPISKKYLIYGGGGDILYFVR